MALSAKKSTLPSSSEIQKYLEQLGATAKTLNELSDQLTAEMGEIESAINRLNLGVSAGVEIESGSDNEGLWSFKWRLVYGKEQKWGIRITYEAEDLHLGPVEEQYESWCFKDAPREQRLKAVEKLPSLIYALLTESCAVAEQVTNKLDYAKWLAASFQTPSEGKQ